MDIYKKNKEFSDDIEKKLNIKRKRAVGDQPPPADFLKDGIQSDYIYITDEQTCKQTLLDFLTEEKVINRWTLLNFKNSNKKLKGNFMRLTKYINTSLNLAEITYSEHKFYMWIYDNTVGHPANKNEYDKRLLKVSVELQFYNGIAYECGMSEPSLYRTIKSLEEKNMIHVGEKIITKYSHDKKLRIISKLVGVKKGENAFF